MNTNVNKMNQTILNNKGENNMKTIMSARKGQYKGAAKNIRIRGYRYTPVVPEQKPYVDYSIQGTVVVDYQLSNSAIAKMPVLREFLGRQSNVPNIFKRQYTVSTGVTNPSTGKVISKREVTKLIPKHRTMNKFSNPNMTPQDLHKNRFHYLYNMPSKYVLIIDKLDEEYKSIIKFAITNGCDVSVYDIHLAQEFEFKAVDNLMMCPLFQDFYTPEDKLAENAYYEKCMEYMDKLWDKAEYEIAPLTTPYFMNQIESTYVIQLDVLKKKLVTLMTKRNPKMNNIKATILADDIINKGINYQKMKDYTAKWAPAFGITINTNEFQSTWESFHIFNINKKYDKKEYTGFQYDRNGNMIDESTRVTRTYNDEAGFDPKVLIMQKQRKLIQEQSVDAVELLDTYYNIKYFMANGPEQFLEADYILCPDCGQPIYLPISSTSDMAPTYCKYCDKLIDGRDYETGIVYELGQPVEIPDSNRNYRDALYQITGNARLVADTTEKDAKKYVMNYIKSLVKTGRGTLGLPTVTRKAPAPQVASLDELDIERAIKAYAKNKAEQRKLAEVAITTLD